MYTRDSHHTVSIPVATEGSMSSPPTDCKLEQNTSFVPWDNPYDLISHKVWQTSTINFFIKVRLENKRFDGLIIAVLISCMRIYESIWQR